LTEHPITREVSGDKGRYVIRAAKDLGGEEAELTWSITTPGLVNADHTFVPDSFRGTGAGVALVTRMVADARAEGFRIVPVCPFVNAQRLRHPDWADAFSA
jgi:predicted GNAT family acetyltransferase